MLKPVDPRLALVALFCWVVETQRERIHQCVRFYELANFVVRGQFGSIGPTTARPDFQVSGPRFGSWVRSRRHCIQYGFDIVYLVFLKSRHIPRVVAGFDLAASVLVLLVGFTDLLHPAFTGYGYIPMSIAEFGTGFWLTIVGIRAANGSKPA